MGCITILVGKEASNDGSTIMAHMEDVGSSPSSIKKPGVVEPQPEPYAYRSVVSHVKIGLPAGGLRYTRSPDATGDKGLWVGVGINSARVSMTAAETPTSNERMLAADPLMEPVSTQDNEDEAGYVPEQPGGIGEEDMVVLVLPYVKSAREGVLRLGELLEKYGIYEMNEIGLADADEVWWLETIGEYHWIVGRLPDDAYAVIANQLLIPFFDLRDALGKEMNSLCSKDLREFINENHLNLNSIPDFKDAVLVVEAVLNYGAEHQNGEIDLLDAVEHLRNTFNPCLTSGSHSDTDRVYNTSRVWVLQRYLTLEIEDFIESQDAFTPDPGNLKWCLSPESKITMGDVKYALSYHYQGMSFNLYARKNRTRSLGSADRRGMYRLIGINHTNFTATSWPRPDVPAPAMGLNWIAFGAMLSDMTVPFYVNMRTTPQYLDGTTNRVTIKPHYWQSRILVAMISVHFHETNPHIQRYQQSVVFKARVIVTVIGEEVAKLLATQKNKRAAAKNMENPQVQGILEATNKKIAALLQRETDELLGRVLFDANMRTHNAFLQNNI